MTECKYCKKNIVWQKIKGRWIAFNDDDTGARHPCTPKNRTFRNLFGGFTNG